MFPPSICSSRSRKINRESLFNGYAVKLNDVDTIYEGERIPAIRGITLEIKAGEFVCIIGPNGAGKTTLLETINGILPSTRGKVYVFGKDVKEFGHFLRREIGYVPQEVAVDELSPFLVEDVVMMGRFGKIGILKSSTSDDFEAVKRAINWVGINDLVKRPVGKLSGGQLQRVMIARAFAKEPKILLLDEPFSSLDIKASQEISRRICELHRDFGLTTIMVTHDITSVPEMCGRAILMNNGEIIREKIPREILQLDRLRSLYEANNE